MKSPPKNTLEKPKSNTVLDCFESECWVEEDDDMGEDDSNFIGYTKMNHRLVYCDDLVSQFIRTDFSPDEQF